MKILIMMLLGLMLVVLLDQLIAGHGWLQDDICGAVSVIGLSIFTVVFLRRKFLEYRRSK